jgi:hypothetical protein
VQALTPADYRPRPPDHCLFPCAATRQTNGLQATDAAEPLLTRHTKLTQKTTGHSAIIRENPCQSVAKKRL